MQSPTHPLLSHSKLERLAKVLGLAGWINFWIQLGLATVSGLMLVFAISGRNFSQAIAPVPGVLPGAVGNLDQATLPGLGIGIFWAGLGILTLLVSVYLAFRQTRLAKRLRNPQPSVHPHKAEVMQVLRWGVIAGLVGMALTILGGGATLGYLLAKSLVQTQGVAIYNPARMIRSLDIFVALANMNGIAAHFIGMVTSLGLFNWVHHQ